VGLRYTVQFQYLKNPDTAIRPAKDPLLFADVEEAFKEAEAEAGS
jgi:hypothetical protein